MAFFVFWSPCICSGDPRSLFHSYTRTSDFFLFLFHFPFLSLSHTQKNSSHSLFLSFHFRPISLSLSLSLSLSITNTCSHSRTRTDAPPHTHALTHSQLTPAQIFTCAVAAATPTVAGTKIVRSKQAAISRIKRTRPRACFCQLQLLLKRKLISV